MARWYAFRPAARHMPDPDGRLLVADQENDRIQVFRTDGSYLEDHAPHQVQKFTAAQAEG